MSLLVERRRIRPAAGSAPSAERTLGVPEEHLKFPLWYRKQRHWIEVLDSGQIAITIEGIDRLADKDLALREDRLLPETASPRSSGRSSTSESLRAISGIAR